MQQPKLSCVGMKPRHLSAYSYKFFKDKEVKNILDVGYLNCISKWY